MMSTPWPSLIICLAYFAFVKMGPTLMADRQPFELKKVLIVYNFCMVLLSTYCFVEVRAQKYLVILQNESFKMAHYTKGYRFLF